MSSAQSHCIVEEDGTPAVTCAVRNIATGRATKARKCPVAVSPRGANKKLGRVPPGGGHRVTGRAGSPPHNHLGVGYEHLEVFVDDASRLTFLQRRRTRA